MRYLIALLAVVCLAAPVDAGGFALRSRQRVVVRQQVVRQKVIVQPVVQKVRVQQVVAYPVVQQVVQPVYAQPVIKQQFVQPSCYGGGLQLQQQGCAGLY